MIASKMIIENGHDKAPKKQKRKYQSPFRIKVGCLVALRYRSRGNQVSLCLADDNLTNFSRVDTQGGDKYGSFPEPVASAHFSEVWTDPQRGRDDGLALIGSRIRCFFSKAILSEPYNAKSRLLEGTVVDVHGVRDYENQITSKQRFASEPSSFAVDLLVDNKNDKTLSITFPFLKRLDNDGQRDPVGKIVKESEQRRRQYEERIKGGKHKAVVRISLSNSSFSNSSHLGRSVLDAKWVIRKRVPTKILRRELSNQIVTEAATTTIDDKGKEVSRENNDDIAEKNDFDNKRGTTITSPFSQASVDSMKKKGRNKHPDDSTSFNKDFSLPRYLGDGNDSTTQQEGNWRWEVGRYHNPCHAALAGQPVSKALLEKLSYNFVGEVVNIHQIQPQQLKKQSIDTLAMVTIRLLVLPEHTRLGRQSHHGPLDLFESDDLETNKSSQEEIQNSIEHTQQKFLCVPIEELVIVERKICRKFLGSDMSQENIEGRREMTIKHSYSFLNDQYSPFENKNHVSKSLGDKLESIIAGSQICHRCRHFSAVTKRLNGIPHLLCQTCFDVLKVSIPARWDVHQKGKSKRYRCDCCFCVDRNNSGLLLDLADEVSESESKAGSTLHEIGGYSAHSDSGFIATRFILKGMDPIDFSVSPSSLASYISSSSSKPVTKIKTRFSKATKKTNIKKSSRGINNTAGSKKEDSKSRSGQRDTTYLSSRENGKFSRLMSKNEAFRSTSARLLPYDVSNRKFDVSISELYQWKLFRSPVSAFPEKPRNIRQQGKDKNEGASSDDKSAQKKLQGRAARAKQRRLLRGISSLGVNVDTLAGREANIRFDRSNIHGWGVFTDIDIKQGDMIIEYRGELIGNAMAEKREKEYEAAKIGSDYMFRIDEYIVCDATKQGNKARFINTSCSPNCYPKIIYLDGMKRIVIYAKRDIRSGEELSYDYKFDLEPDPAKRIPCICGAPNCRGFLNWDKNLVDLPSKVPSDISAVQNQSTENIKTD